MYDQIFVVAHAIHEFNNFTFVDLKVFTMQAMIGPSNWRNSTLKEIKLSQSVVNRSDAANRSGRAGDPLPSLRETVAELSNEEAHKYFRQVIGLYDI